MRIIDKKRSQDGSIKYLFDIDNKYNTNAIYFTFRGKYRGKSIDDKVICLSSQVGCKVKCPFCATGKMKNYLNLNVENMDDQVNLIREDISQMGLPAVNYYALMGMGEPLLNLTNVRYCQVNKTSQFLTN